MTVHKLSACNRKWFCCRFAFQEQNTIVTSRGCACGEFEINATCDQGSHTNTEVGIPLKRFLRSPYSHVAPLASEDRGGQGRPMTPLVHSEQIASCLHLIKHPCGC